MAAYYRNIRRTAGWFTGGGLSSQARSTEEMVMTCKRIERYDIEPRPLGIVIRLRQRRRALSVAVVSVAVLFVSWWFGPYGPRPTPDWGQSELFYWLWSGFFSLILMLGLIGAFRQEGWTIAEHEIVATKYVGPWRTTRRVPKGPHLGIRIQRTAPRDHGPTFPYRLRFLDAHRNDSGLRVDLRRAPSVDQFLDALRAVLTLDVDDSRQGSE
jgi:hypothetical protein